MFGVKRRVIRLGGIGVRSLKKLECQVKNVDFIQAVKRLASGRFLSVAVSGSQPGVILHPGHI